MTQNPPLPPLPDALVKEAVAQALREDLGAQGDVTSQAVTPETAQAEAAIIARQNGVLAGLALAVETFASLDAGLDIKPKKQDGDTLAAGDVVLHLRGAARAMLAGERVALNYLGHLSGIASQTALYVAAVRDTKAQITCTRKTTPNLRALEKYAVLAGGGVNHRLGLYDALLVKDNHIAIAGSVAAATKAALANSNGVKVEIEVDNLAQLEEALAAGAQAVLLDNMPPPMLGDAMGIIDGRAVAEASGNVCLENVQAIAATGVDYISVGRITHSAPCLDLGLDFTNFSQGV